MTVKTRLCRFEIRTKTIQIMSTKDTENKTADTWTTKVDEIFTKYGLKRNFENKTGSCIMPAPKHLQSAKQRQKSKNQEAEVIKEAKQNG